MLYPGLFDVPVDGRYAFDVTSSQGAVLRIHQALAVDAPTAPAQDRAPVSSRGILRLQAGKHPFRLSVLGQEPPTLTWHSYPHHDGAPESHPTQTTTRSAAT